MKLCELLWTPACAGVTELLFSGGNGSLQRSGVGTWRHETGRCNTLPACAHIGDNDSRDNGERC
jgi:hypothetical protein